MKTYPTKNIRNILLLGHGGCGKTTLTEALAFNAGAIDRMGRIDEGNTLSDFDAEEKRRMFSISSSVIPVNMAHKINIIDVPGYFDFIGDAYAALRVANAAVIVVDALSGFKVGTEKALELLEKADIPAFIVVNKGPRQRGLRQGSRQPQGPAAGQQGYPVQRFRWAKANRCAGSLILSI